MSFRTQVDRLYEETFDDADMNDRMKAVLRKTWDAIYPEVSSLAGGEENLTISDVIDYVDTYYDLHGDDREAVKAISKLTGNEFQRLARVTFGRMYPNS